MNTKYYQLQTDLYKKIHLVGCFNTPFLCGYIRPSSYVIDLIFCTHKTEKSCVLLTYIFEQKYIAQQTGNVIPKNFRFPLVWRLLFGRWASKFPEAAASTVQWSHNKLTQSYRQHQAHAYFRHPPSCFVVCSSFGIYFRSRRRLGLRLGWGLGLGFRVRVKVRDKNKMADGESIFSQSQRAEVFLANHRDVLGAVFSFM